MMSGTTSNEINFVRLSMPVVLGWVATRTSSSCCFMTSSPLQALGSPMKDSESPEKIPHLLPSFHVILHTLSIFWKDEVV